ncbi:MAG TPA: DUF4190 domain-containing protein [Marmoricola sp.]|nr:DUF4190 domain-containing protein [Marmoricola sp.]
MSQPPPPPPPPEYGQPYGQGGEPYGPGQPVYGQPQSSTKAIVALVLGILGLVGCGIIAGIPALIVGRSAVKEIDASGGRIGGRGMATAGWVLGVVEIVLAVIGGIVLAVIFASGSAGNP